MLIAVTGGRDYGIEYKEWSVILNALKPYAKSGNVLLAGSARGVDTVAETIWVDEFQLPVMIAPAKWNRNGKAAGIVRNIALLTGTAFAPHMVDPPDVLLAFPGGKGTAHAVKTAIENQIPVEYYGR